MSGGSRETAITSSASLTGIRRFPLSSGQDRAVARPEQRQIIVGASKERSQPAIGAAVRRGPPCVEAAIGGADICPRQIYRWRQELRTAASGFAPMLIAPPGMPTVADGSGCDEAAIEVEFTGKARVQKPDSALAALAVPVVRARPAGDLAATLLFAD
jgi:hypothetical protein